MNVEICECMWSLGKWESDTDLKATCKKDKVEILEYCKKVTTLPHIIAQNVTTAMS